MYLYIVLLYLSLTSATIAIKGASNVTFTIYQWSRIGTFPNNTLEIYTNLNHSNVCFFLRNVTNKYQAQTEIENLMVQNQNISCVLVPISSTEVWYYHTDDILDTPFPVGLLLISSPALLNAFNKTSVNIGKFVSWDINLSAQNLVLLATFLVINLIMDTTCLCWGLWKLFQRYQVGQFQLNVATVCLSFECTTVLFRGIGNLMALLLFTVPYIPVLTNLIYTGCYYIAFPFTLNSGVYIIFFWIDITSRSLYHGAFLDRAFWPATILVSIAFIISEIFAVFYFRGLYLTYAAPVTAALLVLFGLVSFIYFIAAGRLMKYTKERNDPIRQKEMNKMAIKLIVSGVVMLVLIGMHGLIWVFSGVNNLILRFTTLNILFSTRSLLLVDLFGKPPGQKSKSTKSTTNSIPDTNSPPITNE